MRQEVTQEAVKALPPATVTGWAWLYGLTISDAVALATIAYIVLQAIYLLWKWHREWQRSRNGK